MSRRREVEARLALYGDLSGILGAMRSFALTELHRVTRHEEAQRENVRLLRKSLALVAPFLPPPPVEPRDTWLLLGSGRGFCGSFNEDVVRAWRARAPAAPPIVVGERLAAVMPPGSTYVSVPGAEGGLDAAIVIDRILAALFGNGEGARGPATGGLVACVRDEDGVRIERLLPLAAEPGIALRPEMNESPASVAAGVARHYLFHNLLAVLLCSIRTENRMRLMQMEGALHHLDREGEELGRQRNRLRQEEIVEEIELMASGHGPANGRAAGHADHPRTDGWLGAPASGRR